MNDYTQIKIVRMSITVKLQSGEQLTYMTGIPVYFEWTSEHDVTVYGCENKPMITPCKVQQSHIGYIGNDPMNITKFIANLYLTNSWRTYNGY